MKTSVKAALLAASILALPAAAQAETFLATSFTVQGEVNVPMDLPRPQTVQAGQIQLSGPTGSLLVWCLDLLDTLSVPYLYNVNTLNTGDSHPGLPVLTGPQIRQIASLMADGIDPNDGLSRAATQIAIWKVEFGGLFDPLGLSPALQSDVDFRLLASVIGGALDCPTCSLRVLTDAPLVPDQALGFAVNTVPLPGAIWLFGGGLLGLYRLTRKNKAAA